MTATDRPTPEVRDEVWEAARPEFQKSGRAGLPALRAALAAVVPLVQAEARRPHARLVRELKVLADEYESYPAWDRPARDLRNLIARAVATGDEGGQ